MSLLGVSPEVLEELLNDFDERNRDMGQMKAIRDVAHRFGLSETTVWRAVKLRSGHPELFGRVISGELAISRAWTFRGPSQTNTARATVRPHANPKAVERKQLQILAGVEGAAMAMTETCSELDLRLALSAAEPGVKRRLEKAFKETTAALNQIRREIRASEAENKERD